MIRKKDILALEPTPASGMGGRVTAQVLGNVLILNCYRNKVLIGRWCMDTGTGFYQAWSGNSGEWSKRKLMSIYGYNPDICIRYSWYKEDGGTAFDTEKDEDTVKRILGKKYEREKNMFRLIGSCEEDYGWNQRKRAEERKQERLERQMESVPTLPPGLKEWLHKVMGGEDYLFLAKGGKGRWICTGCGAVLSAGELAGEDRETLREGSRLACPHCRRSVQYMGRKRVIRRQTHCIVLQDMGGNESVARHIDIRVTWDNQGRHMNVSEAVRLIMYREYKRHPCEIYYAQRCMTDWTSTKYFGRVNEANRKMDAGYLYPEGIREALSGTRYEVWGRIFEAAAEKSLHMDYNLAMCGAGDKGFVGLCEYLIKGRFYRLLADSVGHVSLCYGGYRGPLNKRGTSIEEVFGIRDRQKINRIRDMDGGGTVLEWMRFSDLHNRKVSQEFLEWAQEHRVRPGDIEKTGSGMSPEQFMNYIKRQRKESYPKKTERETLEQWLDYLDMCRRLKKNLGDPMISRPRELKRRHDEAVEALNRIRILAETEWSREQAKEQERKMREKYPGAEENLEEVREKYEYESGEYRILVPKKLSEIALEGQALHHCVSSSERYYERIMHHETYICFLRKASDPDVPFYTIEVEPGGTIRQHRSMYDEEPGIEEIRGFLREWQQVIHRRMKAEDHRRAGVSRQLREDNIRQLKEANNTRVLRGLMEDFMAADETTPEAI